MRLGLSLALGNLLNSTAQAAPAFSPSTLFSSTAIGIWLDPSDLSTMFSDRAGTTPVTAPGTVVGLRLDKSKGLTLGAELVANGDFSSAAGWTLTNASIGSGVLSATAPLNTTFASRLLTASMTAGRSYEVRLTVSNFTGGSFLVQIAGGAQLAALDASANGSYRALATATASHTIINLRSFGSGFTGTIDNISVRELAGNHAVAPTDAARPIYGVEPKGGRRNLLTYSEQFDNAVWGTSAATVSANSPLTTAPDGTSTADLLTADGTSASHFIRPSTGSWTAGGTFTETVYIKRNTGNFAHLLLEGVNAYLQFSLTDGSTTFSSAGTATNFAVLVTDVGSGWYRARLTATNTGASTFRVRYYVLNASNNTAAPSETTTASMFIWGAQLELGSTVTPYQRVLSAYDVTESGVPTCHYVQYDGSDDSMSTAAIDFTATDKMSVFAGVRKSGSDGMMLELGPNVNGSSGSFAMYPGAFGVAGSEYAFISGGTLRPSIDYEAGLSVPYYGLMTGLGDISGDLNRLRVNGTQVGQTTSDQGTGNFGNYSLFMGRRNNSGFPFNGRDYGLIVVGKAASAGEITDTELWLSDKTAEVDVAKSISPNIYTRSGDTILDRANSIIERRTV